MIVLGGGPVGSELAQAWSSLGTDGHPDRGRRAAALARGALRRRASREGAARGARRRRPHRRPRQAGRAPAARGVVVELSDGTTVEAAELLVAVGRKPSTDGIGLESVGCRARRRAASSRPTTGCGSAAATGSTRSATSTAGRSSPTWASTRPGSSPRTCSGARSRRRRRDRLAPRHLHRPTGRGGRQDARPGRGSRDRRQGGRRPDRRHRGRQLPRQGNRRHLADRRRRGAQDDRRRHLHRLRDRRLPARGDGRGRRRGPARPPAPRGRGLPDPQRGLAEAPRGLRALDCGERSDGRAALQVVEDILREAGHLIEVVDRLEAAEALAVGEQASRLGDREIRRRAAARR